MSSELERLETQILKHLDDQNTELDRLFEIVETKRMFDEDEAEFRHTDIEKLEFENQESKDRMFHACIDYMTTRNYTEYMGSKVPMDNKTYVQTIAVHENTRNTLAQLHNYFSLIKKTALDNEHNKTLLSKIKSDLERIDEAIQGVNALLDAIKYKNKLDNMVCEYANKFNVNLDELDEQVTDE